MLPAANRLTGSREFSATVREGRRSGRRHLVVHLVVPAGSDPVGEGDAAAPRVGFVVSRAVGNAVVRTRVKRRLRHVVRDRLSALPDGAVAVVRALPAAAGATSTALAADLDRALARCLEPVVSPAGAAS